MFKHFFSETPLATQMLNVMLPPLCLRCDAVVAETESLCQSCWPKMQYLSAPQCACCGLPFDIPMEETALCGDCLRAQPHFTAARSVLLYNQESRDLVLGFKHGDQTHLAPAFAEWMLRVLTNDMKKIDAIVPIPLHRRRLFERRYNQAGLIAAIMAKKMNVPYQPEILRRWRATPSQGHKSRNEREKNVAGAFDISHKKADIKGRRYLLVDDVLTTGATANECARILKNAGAEAIYVITLARTRSVAT
jgi:ComF family protein